jgi:hypothetical protein
MFLQAGGNRICQTQEWDHTNLEGQIEARWIYINIQEEAISKEGLRQQGHHSFEEQTSFAEWRPRFHEEGPRK